MAIGIGLVTIRTYAVCSLRGLRTKRAPRLWADGSQEYLEAIAVDTDVIETQFSMPGQYQLGQNGREAQASQKPPVVNGGKSTASTATPKQIHQ